MPQKTIKLKTTRATNQEIDAVSDLLSELGDYYKYFRHQHLKDAIEENKEDFPILSQLNYKEDEDFIDSLCQYINNMRHEVVFFNLRVLLDNCIDLNADTLEFNKKISEALALAEKKNTPAQETEQHKQGTFRMGRCSIIVSIDEGRWHLSISTATASPSYKEIKQARYKYIPNDVYMAQIFPPEQEFVNVHPYCHHLWQVEG